MSAYDSRPRRIPSLSERERPDSPLEDGLETDRQFLENDNLNTISIIGTDFHDKVLAIVEPRKKLIAIDSRDIEPANPCNPRKSCACRLSPLLLTILFSVIFFSTPPEASQNSRNPSHF